MNNGRASKTWHARPQISGRKTRLDPKISGDGDDGVLGASQFPYLWERPAFEGRFFFVSEASRNSGKTTTRFDDSMIQWAVPNTSLGLLL